MGRKQVVVSLAVTFCILIFLTVTSTAEDKVKDDVDRMMEDLGLNDQHHTVSRTKRQISGGVGMEACTQTYIVPKRAVSCDPSPEVRGKMTEFQESLKGHVTQLEQLSTRIDTLDPDVPRELPPEVKERLDTIITVRETQAGHQEALRRIDEQMGRLGGRISDIEAADRQQVAKLIEQQTKLIRVTLHQSNMTLHEEYIDRLTESTRDLTDKLRTLEDNLKSKIEEAENKLEQAVQQTEARGNQNVDQTKNDLSSRLSAVEQKLSTESTAREGYQMKTTQNTGEIEELLQLLTTLREHQASYEQDKEQLRAIITELQTSLRAEQEANERLADRAQQLNQTLGGVQTFFEQLRGDLGACNNKSESLNEQLVKLEKRMKDKDHLVPRTLKVSDCRDALTFYYPTTGEYPVNPGQGDPFTVYCDMEDGKGWTLLMRRQDGQLDFFRNWESYKNGFGDLGGEHWLGLEKIHSLTTRKQYKLRVDLQDWDLKWRYAEYDHFYVDSEDKGYKLHVSGYHGNAGDSLRFHDNIGFSTYDRSNDLNDGICARWCHGAWWYRDCFHSNLNGRFYETGAYKSKTGWGDGMVWRSLKDTNFYSVRAVIMKIAPFAKAEVKQDLY